MIRVPTYQSSAGISSLPNVNTGNNYSLDSFGGGANQMPQAIDNFARAAQRLNLQIYNDHMEERQEVLAAELMNNNIDYSTSYQQKLAELEQNYQGMDAKGVVEELDSFHTQQEAALTEKYANNPKAQRAAMLHASRLRGDSGAWSVKHIRNQEQRILEDADNKQNALLVNSFPNMNPEQAEYFINMRAASMANTIYKGRPDAVETAKEKLKMAYMEQLAENKPGEFLSLYTSTGNMKENLPQGEIGEWLQQAAEKEGLPVELLTKVGRTESNFDPEAVSSAGARGIFQFMPNTAKEMGITNPHDPKQSIFGGAKYLAQLNKKYNGDQKLTLMAYNWGPGNVDAWLKTGKGTKGQAVPQETTNYLTKILNNSDKPNLPGDIQKQLITKAETNLRQQSTVLTTNLDSQLFYGMTTGNYEAVLKTKEALSKLGQNDLVKGIEEQIKISQHLTPFLKNDSNVPFVEREAGLKQTIYSLATPDNALQLEKVKNDSLKALEQEKLKFTKDPAGYVDSFISRMPGRENTNEELNTTPENTIKTRLAMQADMGEGLLFDPKAIPQAEAQQLLVKYNKLGGGAAKQEFLEEMKNQYGEYAADIALEANLSPITSFLISNSESFDSYTTELILGADGIDIKDIPSTPETKKETLQRVEDSEFIKTLKTISGAMPQNGKHLIAVNDLINSLHKAEMMGVPITDKLSSNYVISQMSYPFSPVIAPHALIIPKDLYRETGLPEESVLRTLSEVQRDYADKADPSTAMRLRNDSCCWVMDGTDVVLIDGGTGQFARTYSGEEIRVKYSDLPMLLEHYQTKNFEQWETLNADRLFDNSRSRK